MKTGYLLRDTQGADPSRWIIVDAGGAHVTKAPVATKAEARDVAQQHGVALLEHGMTEHHLQALLLWREHYGVQWKRHLRSHWLNPEYIPSQLRNIAPLLRQVRNTLGPAWLITFKLPENQ